MTDYPPFTFDPAYRDDLAECALYLLRQREEAWPRQIEAGKLSAAAAKARLETTRCLVAQWRWVTDPACPPQPEMDRTAALFGQPSWIILAEVEKIAATARARADHSGATDRDGIIALQCEALLHYQQPCTSFGSAFARIVTFTTLERQQGRPWRAQGLARFDRKAAA